MNELAFNSAQNHINVILDSYQRKLGDSNTTINEDFDEVKSRINNQLDQLRQYTTKP